MNTWAPVTSLSDPRRVMPSAPGARLEAAEAAMVSLEAELRRLSRLGLEWPLARAEHQRRYWRFVRALCAVAVAAEPDLGRAA